MAADCVLLAISDGSSPTGSRQSVVALLQPFVLDRRDRIGSLGRVPDLDGRSVGRGLDKFNIEKFFVHPNIHRTGSRLRSPVFEGFVLEGM